MSDYTIQRAAEATDYSGDGTPGAFLGYSMGSEQLGFNLRVLEPGQAHHLPGKESLNGHSHKDIEELYLVIEGELTFQIEDETVTVGPRDALLIPPEVRRGMRNDGDATATVVMASQKMSDPQGQSEFYEGFLQDRS